VRCASSSMCMFTGRISTLALLTGAVKPKRPKHQAGSPPVELARIPERTVPLDQARVQLGLPPHAIDDPERED